METALKSGKSKEFITIDAPYLSKVARPLRSSVFTNQIKTWFSSAGKPVFVKCIWELKFVRIFV